MRRLSIKTRVTLWYALLLILICALILGLMVAAAERTAWDYCLETLKSASAIVMDETEYEHGELEIDADIDDVPNVYASLFEADGRLIYGRVWVDAPFEAGVMRRIDGAGSSWYIYDTLLTYSWRDDVYLRLHMNADMSLNAYTSMIQRGFWLFPLTAALALLGGMALKYRTDGMSADGTFLKLCRGYFGKHYLAVKYRNIQYVEFSQSFLAAAFDLKKGRIHLLASSADTSHGIPYFRGDADDVIKNGITGSW